MAKDNNLAEETVVAVVWISTVIALKEVASEGEAMVVMTSDNAVALQALAEVVEASIRERISKVVITNIRTLTQASHQEAEETGALVAPRGSVALKSLTIMIDHPWILVEVATQVSGARKIDLRQWVEAVEGPWKDKTTHKLGTNPSARKRMNNLWSGLNGRKTLQVLERSRS
jgi:hypothetical protein